MTFSSALRPRAELAVLLEVPVSDIVATIVLDQTRANFTRVLDMSVGGSVYGIDGPPWDPNTTISTPSVTRTMRKVRPR